MLFVISGVRKSLIVFLQHCSLHLRDEEDVFCVCQRLVYEPTKTLPGTSDFWKLSGPRPPSGPWKPWGLADVISNLSNGEPEGGMDICSQSRRIWTVISSDARVSNMTFDDRLSSFVLTCGACGETVPRTHMERRRLQPCQQGSCVWRCVCVIRPAACRLFQDSNKSRTDAGNYCSPLTHSSAPVFTRTPRWHPASGAAPGLAPAWTPTLLPQRLKGVPEKKHTALQTGQTSSVSAWRGDAPPVCPLLPEHIYRWSVSSRAAQSKASLLQVRPPHCSFRTVFCFMLTSVRPKVKTLFISWDH